VHDLLRRALLVPALLALAAFPGETGCREKVTAAQCEALIGRYAELVVRDKMPGASDEIIKGELKTVREEAKSEDAFHNCTTEVGPKEYACAMAAATPDAVEKCLE
jgi:hypothetical protein